MTAVREAFDPVVAQRKLFLVPGNHDVNRGEISKFETSWLKEEKSLDTITQLLQENGTDWRRIVGRLNDYARFLENYGYDHLLTGRDHLIYADAREVAGLRVGIAGFNSAWSSTGSGRAEMGKLWMAGRFQLKTLRQQLPPHDFAIALMHHPSNWLVPEENPSFGRAIERDFQFVLHGHEHQDFVKAEASTGHAVISAGACHEWSESKNNGYNFVRLNVQTGQGEVWLRQYENTGGGWIPRIITGRTDSLGCWPLKHLSPWMDQLSQSASKQETVSSALEGKGDRQSGSVSSQEQQLEQSDSTVINDPAIDYEKRYYRDSTRTVVQKLVSDVDDWSDLPFITETINQTGELPYWARWEIQSLSSVVNLTNLTKLYLSGTQVSDVTALANLSNLTKLYLYNTQVSDVTALANLSNLTSLNLPRD